MLIPVLIYPLPDEVLNAVDHINGSRADAVVHVHVLWTIMVSVESRLVLPLNLNVFLPSIVHDRKILPVERCNRTGVKTVSMLISFSFKFIAIDDVMPPFEKSGLPGTRMMRMPRLGKL